RNRWDRRSGRRNFVRLEPHQSKRRTCGASIPQLHGAAGGKRQTKNFVSTLAGGDAPPPLFWERAIVARRGRRAGAIPQGGVSPAVRLSRTPSSLRPSYLLS